MRKAIEIIRNLLAGIAVLIIVCVASCAVLQIKPAVVLSGSMEPTIHTGSLALINERDRDIEVGDVIAFQVEDMFITHRVIEITDDGYYITKGDNNDTPDAGQLSKSMIRGTTICSIPKIGFLIEASSTTSGIIVLSTVCIVLILLSFLCRKEGAEGNDEKRAEDAVEGNTGED